MAKHKRKGGKGGAIVLAGGGALDKPGGGATPQLKKGASDLMWEGAASYGMSKYLTGEIDKIYRKHNLQRKVVPIDPKKPADEGAAHDEIKSLLMKVGLGGVFAKRMLADQGDLASHVSTAALHQAAGAAARDL